MPPKRIWSSKWQTKTKKKKQAIYRAWPWISNCWEWDPNSGLSGLKSSALTTRPRRPGANLRRDATSHVLFLNQSVLADFDDRKKQDSHFKTRSLSGTSNNTGSGWYRTLLGNDWKLLGVIITLALLLAALLLCGAICCVRQKRKPTRREDESMEQSHVSYLLLHSTPQQSSC